MSLPRRCAYLLIFAIWLLVSLTVLSPWAAAKAPKTKNPVQPAVPYTFEKPADWVLSSAGDCDTLTLYLRNPASPLEQLFFFPRLGPVYMTQAQKANDVQYEVLSGRALNRLDMPVVQPLTPENFAKYIPQILQMASMREFLPDRPDLRLVEPIATQPQKAVLDYPDTKTAIIRILFVQNNQLGEGLLAITTLPSLDFRSSADGGIGTGLMFYGLTAPKGRLSDRLPTLLAAGRSFQLGAEYEKTCHKKRAEDAPQLLPDGNSLRPVLNSLAVAWEKRTPAEDMQAEKKADSLRETVRLYLPATGIVYEFPLGFAAEYAAQPDRFGLPGLVPLPDDPELWRKIPLNGLNAVTKK